MKAAPFQHRVAAAMRRDEPRLVSLGPTVRRLGIEHFAQQFLHRQRLGIAGKVPQFFGVALQIEQFGFVPAKMDVLVTPLADHIGGRFGSGGVVFAQHRALRVVLLAGDAQQGPARQIRGRVQPGAFKDRRGRESLLPVSLPTRINVATVVPEKWFFNSLSQERTAWLLITHCIF